MKLRKIIAATIIASGIASGTLLSVLAFGAPQFDRGRPPAHIQFQGGQAQTAQAVPSKPPQLAPQHAVAETEHASAEHADAEHGPPPMNWLDLGNKEQPPYIALLVNLGLLVGIYYGFGKKPISLALVQRRESIAKEIEDADRMVREASARAKEYQARLTNLDEELEMTKKALIETGKGERERIIREAEDKAERMQKDASFVIDQERKQVALDLVRETVELSVASAEELLRQRITPADHERLAEEFLVELGGNRRLSGAPAGGAS